MFALLFSPVPRLAIGLLIVIFVDFFDLLPRFSCLWAFPCLSALIHWSFGIWISIISQPSIRLMYDWSLCDFHSTACFMTIEWEQSGLESSTRWKAVLKGYFFPLCQFRFSCFICFKAVELGWIIRFDWLVVPMFYPLFLLLLHCSCLFCVTVFFSIPDIFHQIVQCVSHNIFPLIAVVLRWCLTSCFAHSTRPHQELLCNHFV